MTFQQIDIEDKVKIGSLSPKQRLWTWSLEHTSLCTHYALFWYTYLWHLHSALPNFDLWTLGYILYYHLQPLTLELCVFFTTAICLLTCDFHSLCYYWQTPNLYLQRTSVFLLTFVLFFTYYCTLCYLLRNSKFCITYPWALYSALHITDLCTLCYLVLTSELCIFTDVKTKR